MHLLTPKQLKLLEWIENFLREKGHMPSRREMAEGMGVSSVATIQQHIEAIESKGFLKLKEGAGRGVTLSRRWEKSKAQRIVAAAGSAALHAVGRSESSHSDFHLNREFLVPLLGQVAAGFPIEVFSQDETVAIPSSMRGSGKRELFALRVQGDSMIENGILNDDIVICEKRETARSGETVVALWKGEATLKRFETSEGGIELHPANPRYPVMQVRAEDSFQVQGVLTGVVRNFGRPRLSGAKK